MSAETTLLVALPEIASNLGLMSVTKTDDRHYWHIIIFEQMDGSHAPYQGDHGPDLTDFNISPVAKSAMMNPVDSDRLIRRRVL